LLRLSGKRALTRSACILAAGWRRTRTAPRLPPRGFERPPACRGRAHSVEAEHADDAVPRKQLAAALIRQLHHEGERTHAGALTFDQLAGGHRGGASCEQIVDDEYLRARRERVPVHFELEFPE